jgi:hypothetical protein
VVVHGRQRQVCAGICALNASSRDCADQFFYRKILPYHSEYSQKLELEWGRFRSGGASEAFMLQELPGRKWRINFLQMIQQNTDVNIFAPPIICAANSCSRLEVFAT